MALDDEDDGAFCMIGRFMLTSRACQLVEIKDRTFVEDFIADVWVRGSLSLQLRFFSFCLIEIQGMPCAPGLDCRSVLGRFLIRACN